MIRLNNTPHGLGDLRAEGRLSLLPRKEGAVYYFLLIFLLALPSCTLEPLYGSFGPDGPTAPIGAQLSNIDISPVAGRTGIELRNELIFVLTGGGQPANKGRYRLDIATQENLNQANIEQISGRPTAGLMYISATYTLTDKQTNKKVFESRSFARATYDEGVQRFANIRANRDAEDRAVKTLAQEIRNSLAIYFAQVAQGLPTEPVAAAASSASPAPPVLPPQIGPYGAVAR